jgi:hypothetical protein
MTDSVGLGLMTCRALGVVLSLILATNALAYQEMQVSLRELYSISSVVAVVEVLDGRVVAAGGQSCGARYRGKVIEATKNASVGQLVEFGFAPFLKIGSKYFVLLDGYENVRIDLFPDFQPRCQGVLPGLSLVGLGRGAMEVTSSVENPSRRESWTIKRANHVDYPIGTRSTLVNGERQLVFTDMVARMKGEK